MKELGTVEQELAACRAAFVGVKAGDPVRCCHHERLVEILDDNPEARISYILAKKSHGEQARRFHEMRPIPKDIYDDYRAKRKLLDDDYWAKCKPLYDDYRAKRKPLDDDYWAKRKPLDDDYEAKRKPLDKPIVDLVPDTTWNGKSIL